MSKRFRMFTCLTVAFALFVTSVSPSFASDLPFSSAPDDAVASNFSDLSQSSELPSSEAESTEGGIPLAVVMALIGSGSAMGFYLYGVLVQHKRFSWKAFAKRGGCGALVGLLGRVIATRAAWIRIFGSVGTGGALAHCYSR